MPENVISLIAVGISGLTFIVLIFNTHMTSKKDANKGFMEEITFLRQELVAAKEELAEVRETTARLRGDVAALQAELTKRLRIR